MLSGVKILPYTLLDELAAQAAATPRARAHYILHASAADPVQRFIVTALRDAYFRPHRHTARSELAVVLRGRFDVLTFDERGRVLARHAVGEHSGAMAYETPQGTWHTLVPGAAGGSFLEVKQGPYDPATAADFAAWAPAEGATGVAAFLEWLRAAQPGDTVPGG
jgi:cupin fold WbuC family metalloprotein